jgi:hypothetical protein
MYAYHLFNVQIKVQAMRYAHVHFGFRQKNTSSIRSCSQNTGPTYKSAQLSVKPFVHIFQYQALTFVTKRLKLFDTKGKLNASFCELNSRTLPMPTVFTLGCIFGKFAGSKLFSTKSETFVDKDAALVGTENLRGGGAAGAEGGKEGALCGLGVGTAGLAVTWGGTIGAAHAGTSIYGVITVMLEQGERMIGECKKEGL